MACRSISLVLSKNVTIPCTYQMIILTFTN